MSNRNLIVLIVIIVMIVIAVIVAKPFTASVDDKVGSPSPHAIDQ